MSRIKNLWELFFIFPAEQYPTGPSQRSDGDSYFSPHLSFMYLWYLCTLYELYKNMTK